MPNREQFPLADLDLVRRHHEHETWEQQAQYETAYQLARIADALDRLVETLPLAGKGY